MEIDLAAAELGAFVALSIVGLAFSILWLLDRRRDDVMQRVHGDQPRLPQ